jgi:hypothetical protein
MPNYHLRYLGNEIILKITVQTLHGSMEEFTARVPGNPGTLDDVTVNRLHAYLLGKLEQMLS